MCLLLNVILYFTQFFYKNLIINHITQYSIINRITMESLYYDAFISIIQWLDLESLVQLLNTNNKQMYYNCIRYIRQKKIYRDITRYDICRFKRFEQIFYTRYFPRRKVIRSGCSIDVLEYLLWNYSEEFSYKNISENVAKSGILKNLIWLKTKKYKFDFDTFVAAIENGNLENVIFIKENVIDFDLPPNPMVFHVAARHGHFDVMKWLLQNNFRFTDNTFSEAARYGRLDIMIWLLENNCPFSEHTFSGAAENGRINNMKWLYKNKCSFSKSTFDFTAAQGSLDNMKWLFDRNCPFSEYTFEKAAYFGNLENMKWLYSRNCPFTVNTFYNAALHGSLENMQWLFEKKCPFSPETFIAAVRHGDLENMMWLFSNGCTGYNDQGDTCLFCEVLHSNVSIDNMINNMKWLLEHKYTWSENTFIQAVTLKNIKILQYLLENKYPWSKQVFRNAVKYCKEDIVIWLRQNGCPWDPDDLKSFFRKQLYS